ncbi:thrombospondin type-1 domain-containing protein 1-like [Uloborus diversus]|uniref:thrombospondin type-1 domain-containing protein 1-like n=1 Tax=Uloborus diversus TaxID=327109 RepID=UPI00240A1BAC|nr:thrombospondin type-1 domain-containing protein 1-like [Uloborus diversus]
MWFCFLLGLISLTRADADYWIWAAEHHIALSGAVEVRYRIPSSGPELRLQLVQVENDEDKLLAKRDVPPNFVNGKVAFLCRVFERAGVFAFRLVTSKEDKVVARTKNMDVRWPEVTIHVPHVVETYSSNVSVILSVNSVQCKPRGGYTAFIDLIFEGSSPVTWQQPTVLTSKELTSWMWNATFDIVLDCEYFDREGNYTVRVRTSLPNAPIVAVSDPIQVIWSRRYSVSVAKSSVQPCDGSLSVIYRYPRCILDQDRIRVYGKAPKGSLKYIRESRIITGKHSTKLSCDIFQDDYQEYCFSFVSTARNGAVFDLKTHCLPTLTETDSVFEKWSEWGAWSECSSTCGSGTQNRFRLCITSHNGSKCTGRAVQSQKCNEKPCPAAVQTTTEEPAIWKCSCSCEKNITDKMLIKILFSSCDTEINLIAQAWPLGQVLVEVQKLVFPSTENYWLTVRDGKSSLGPVLAMLDPSSNHQPVHSLTGVIRLEIHASNTTLREVEITCLFTRTEIPRASLAMIGQNLDESLSPRLSAVHVTIIMLASVLGVTIICLAFVYLYRQCKLKVTKEPAQETDCPDLLTSTSDLSIKSPSAKSPEDYLYKSFIFRSPSSYTPKPKLKWDKLPPKLEPCDTSSPIRRRGRLVNKNVQRESTAPLAASVSEISMTGSEDGFEYDYYDYGCHQEPGSFFCPDPVLMGWPPFIPLPPHGAEEQIDYPLQHFTPSPEHS